MFEKEYLSQRTILFFSMILILTLICKTYLFDKNGMSSQEGATFAISNASESLQNNPYNTSVYNSETLEQGLFLDPYVFAFGDIFSYIRQIATDPEDNAVLVMPKNYSNKNFVERSYYTNLLSVSQKNQFHYQTVLHNCIISMKAPLYYMILHTISSIFSGLTLYRLGFSINAFFLFIASFLILRIGKKYFLSSWVGLAAALLFSLSLGCFSATLCATPYVMICTFLLISTEIHLSIFKESKTPIFLFEGLAIVNVLGFLTDYSYLVFSTVIAFCFCITCIYLRTLKRILPYLGFNFLSLLITALIYPSILLHTCTVLIKGWHQFVYDFQLEVFRAGCMSNLSMLQGQLFMHTGFLVLLVFLVLSVCAMFYKEGSLFSHIDQFFGRMRSGEIADLFIPFLIIFYFIGISVCYVTDNYFVLVTLLPFIALIVSYIAYRFFNNILRSEVNSGIIGITVTLILCGVSLLTSTPKYLFHDGIQQTTLASSYGNYYCIFLSSEDLVAADHILELEKYNHSIVLYKPQLKSLKKNKDFLAQEQVILYLSNTDSINSVMDQVANYGDFDLTTELTHYADANKKNVYVYQLSRLN